MFDDLILTKRIQLVDGVSRFCDVSGGSKDARTNATFSVDLNSARDTLLATVLGMPLAMAMAALHTDTTPQWTGPCTIHHTKIRDVAACTTDSGREAQVTSDMAARDPGVAELGCDQPPC